jgi:hypothetical protein
MKKQIINVIISILSAGLTNIFSRFLIATFLVNDIKIISIKEMVMCAIFPIVLIFFEKNINRKKLIIISILYSFLFTIFSIYI